jgi:TPR repeat protein
VKGEGIPWDNCAGMALLEAAAEKGRPLVQCQYARFLQNNPGIPPDFVESTWYFKLTADQNNVLA